MQAYKKVKRLDLSQVKTVDMISRLKKASASTKTLKIYGRWNILVTKTMKNYHGQIIRRWTKIVRLMSKKYKSYFKLKSFLELAEMDIKQITSKLTVKN